MPNKHKNRKKQPSQAGNALPSPPATPTSTHNQDFIQRSDLRQNQANSLPTPPPTPDDYGVNGSVPLDLPSKSWTTGPRLSPEEKTIEVIARPTGTFNAPTLNVANGSDSLIPVDYHRWPNHMTEDTMNGEIHSISNGNWGIGNTLRSRVIGKTNASSAELHVPLFF